MRWTFNDVSFVRVEQGLIWRRQCYSCRWLCPDRRLINSVTKRAQFNHQKSSVRFTLDNYGSKRVILNHNSGHAKMAFRVALVAGENQTNRYKLGGELFGLYAQAAFRVTLTTTIRFSTE